MTSACSCSESGVGAAALVDETEADISVFMGAPGQLDFNAFRDSEAVLRTVVHLDVLAALRAGTSDLHTLADEHPDSRASACEFDRSVPAVPIRRDKLTGHGRHCTARHRLTESKTVAGCHASIAATPTPTLAAAAPGSSLPLERRAGVRALIRTAGALVRIVPVWSPRGR